MQKLSKFLEIKDNLKLHIKTYGIHLRHIRRKFIFLNTYQYKWKKSKKGIKFPLKNLEVEQWNKPKENTR